MEAGSVYKGKLKRIELNSSKLYTVLDKKKDEDLGDSIVNSLLSSSFFAPSFGWKIYER